MKGKLAERQFRNWKKAEVMELANKMGVSAEGTVKEIVARICEVEVEVPEESELTPEEVREIRAAEAEEEAKREAKKAEEEAAGKVGVRCHVRFHDLETSTIREVGEEWDVAEKRAEEMIKKELVELI